MQVAPIEAFASELFFHDPGQARVRILALEAAMRAEIRDGNATENTNDMPLKHSFIPGVYARELTIPAGTIAVGRIHRFPCFNMVTQGKITVLTDEGVKTVEAPAFFRSEAGVKRVGVAHTDTVWITVHGSNETDPEQLKAELTCDTYEEFGLLEAPAQEALS